MFSVKSDVWFFRGLYLVLTGDFLLASLWVGILPLLCALVTFLVGNLYGAYDDSVRRYSKDVQLAAVSDTTN